jgi:5-methylcytosine-specific restriction endonuclease McrA
VDAATERAVFERDHYRCCWCGLPVVARAALNAHGLAPAGGDPSISPDGLRTLGGEHTTHVALFGLAAVADHIKPWSAGGTSTLENLVTACNPCNARVHGSATLKCVGFKRRTFDPLPAWPK